MQCKTKQQANMAKETEKDTHRQRILDRMLRGHFKGALVGSKLIIPKKIEMVAITADVKIVEINENKSILYLNYGDVEYSFELIWEIKENIHELTGETNKYIFKLTEIN